MALSTKMNLKLSLRGCFATAAISSLLFLAACGGDSSSSNGVGPADDSISSSTVGDWGVDGNESSSSVTLNDDEGSSSSITSMNSSSSNVATSSSSEENDVDETSSSSNEGTEETSSSSSVELSCADLLERDNGWSWDVPKECRFNPEITYGTMTDSRDNKVYRTVQIGEQTWMAENLNYDDSTMTPSLLERSWCYDNVAANCDVAGRLYTWAAAIDSVKLATDADNPLDCGYGKTCVLPPAAQGICPEGWHLPAKIEWDILVDEVGGSSIAGKVLKSQTGWYNNGNGTDEFGFSALPAGTRQDNGDFFGAGFAPDFWTASEAESDVRTAYDMVLSGIYFYGSSKIFAQSVRCIKD